MTKAVQPIRVSLPASAEGIPLFPTLQEILSADPAHFLKKYTDIAGINLACATGLPKAEDIDTPKYLRLLDAMAKAVRQKTAKHWHLFNERRHQYHNSENVFRVLTMFRVLHTQFGICYNPSRNGGADPDWGDAGDQFINGILGPRKTGTCASLPVFAVAVGRRLGYPLKLVKVPEHLLFRWNGPTERFNVEYSGQGAEVRPDDYYHSWPVKWDEKLHRDNARFGTWLTSVPPGREVAICLEHRAVVLDQLGRTGEAIECLNVAERFDPGTPVHQGMRAYLYIRMAGAEGLPWANVGWRDQVGNRPHGIVVTPLYPMMVTGGPEFFKPLNDPILGKSLGPGLWVNLACVLAEPLPPYWNFVREPPPFPTIEPGPEVLNVMAPFRDQSKDPRHLFIRITKKAHEDLAPLFVHNMRIVTRSPHKKKGLTQ